MSRARTVADFGAGTISAANVTGLTQGIAMVDQWRITANTNLATNGVISTNWEQSDDVMVGTVGSAMTQSSGVFTFPNTGIYMITMYVTFNVRGDGNVACVMQATADNSNWETVAQVYQGNRDASENIQTGANSFVMDVTNTTTHKIRFVTDSMGTSCEIAGLTDRNHTAFTFIRLGDT